MAQRSSQLSASVLEAAPANALVDVRINEVVIEAGNLRAGRNFVEVLYAPSLPLYAERVFDEVLAEFNSPAYVERAFSESIIEGAGNFLASRIFTEVLYGLDEPSPNVERYQPVSNFLFPTLAGLSWNVHKRPKFNTVIAPHVSGREVRVSNYAYPLWEWELSYEFLRAGAEQELQTLIGFFLARSGAFDSFLYKDPNEDNVYTDVAVGTGDAATTKWTLFKTYAGFSEPIGYADTDTLKVYFDGVEQTSGWVFVSPNQIEFITPPAIGVEITADYTWYYRVRFGEDSQDYNNFMFDLWSLKKVTLESIKT